MLHHHDTGLYQQRVIGYVISTTWLVFHVGVIAIRSCPALV